MTGIPDHMLGPGMAASESRTARLIAGGVIINGAALVAVANVVANVQNPDAALAVLLLPMWCFIIGAIAAGVANFLAATAADASVKALLDFMIRERALAAMIEKGLEPKQLAATHAYLYIGDQAPVMTNLQQAHDALIACALKISSRMAPRDQLIARCRKGIRAASAVSAVFLLAGFGVITLNHHRGLRIQPQTTAASPATKPTAVPPLSKGTPSQTSETPPDRREDS